MKLRLLLFERCNRSCPGCCNKDWDLKNLPVCNDFSGYDEILLTGGEPMLDPDLVVETLLRMNRWEDDSKCSYYMYTAKTDKFNELSDVLSLLDGVTITIHEQSDVPPLRDFLRKLPFYIRENKSIRLNVFEGVDTSSVDTRNLVVREGMRWIKDCPLPKGEVFMRLSKP